MKALPGSSAFILIVGKLWVNCGYSLIFTLVCATIPPAESGVFKAFPAINYRVFETFHT